MRCKLRLLWVIGQSEIRIEDMFAVWFLPRIPNTPLVWPSSSPAWARLHGTVGASQNGSLLAGNRFNTELFHPKLKFRGF